MPATGVRGGLDIGGVSTAAVVVEVDATRRDFFVLSAPLPAPSLRVVVVVVVAAPPPPAAILAASAIFAAAFFALAAAFFFAFSILFSSDFETFFSPSAAAGAGAAGAAAGAPGAAGAPPAATAFFHFFFSLSCFFLSGLSMTRSKTGAITFQKNSEPLFESANGRTTSERAACNVLYSSRIDVTSSPLSFAAFTRAPTVLSASSAD